MKLALLGATGGPGSHILDRASARGHDVTALARTPTRLDGAAGKARVIQGDARDPGAIVRGPGLAMMFRFVAY